MEEVKKSDERSTNSWKEDANGIIIFVSFTLLIPPAHALTSWKTSLFSATVAAFIIESYRKLSPDTGDQTIVLLEQISRQLAGLANNTDPIQPATQLFSPSASTIWVNAMWLMSLVLSITSALFATLLQQWARKYVDKPQVPIVPSQCARVHSFLFLGARKYNLRLAVDIAPTLLHLSVFLFFAGLVIFFIPINRTVAIAVSTSVGLFVVAYFTLTILPCIDHACPYRTPLSKIWWLIWHSSLSLIVLCGRWIVRRLHHRLVPYNLGEITSPRQHKVVNWSKILEDAVKKRRYRLKNGFGKGIIQGALDAPVDVDRKALTRLFGLFELAADKSKLPKFMAAIPRDKIVEFMTPPIDSGKIVFRKPLLTLLRNNVVGTRATRLDEDVHRRSLLVCLHAVHHIAKVFIVPNGVPQSDLWRLLGDMRANFAHSSHMQVLWADTDPAIRVISRSICALLARRLVRRDRFEEPELDWLSNVTGQSSDAISNSVGDLPTLDRMNLKSFVFGVFSNQEDDFTGENIPCFAETLAILINAGIPEAFDGNTFRAGLVDLINWTGDDGQDGDFVANKLRSMFQNFLQAPGSAPGPGTMPILTPTTVPKR